MAYIDIIDSNGNDYRYQLPEDGSVLLIGSAEDCSISLPHIADLQPHHCTISLQPEGYVIAAAAAEATLLAESQPVESAILVPQAVYNLGSSMLLYAEAAAEEAAPAATDAPPAGETAQEEEAAPAEEEATAEEEDAPARKKKKKRKAGRQGLYSISSYTEEDSPLHIVLRRLYVILILALAFLAGLTMRYWMITGEYLVDELLK